MRLYDSNVPSGNVYKVQLLLNQLGLPYENVELDLLSTPSETRKAPFLAKNPNGRVPLLELDDGQCLPESNAILCYLAEGTDYLPKDRLERARALSWMFFEQYSHEPYVAVLKFWTYWGGLERCRPEDIERWKTRGQAALDVMAKHLQGRSYFVGERYSVADIALFAYTQSAADIGFRVDPAVNSWMDRVRATPRYVPIKADRTKL
ncbi:MAG: glutathione S-transferase family protein [Myxococcota bacterium]